MTMHLVGPALTLTGKRKGKVKFRNADEARKSRELDSSWKELQKKWKVETDNKKHNRAMKAEPLTYKLTAPAGRTTSTHIPSKVTPGGSTAPVHKEYTGTEILGITIIHKSCLQPVFNQQEAIDAATMRR